MPLISSDAITIADIALTEQSSTPTTPASGKARVYVKSDGLYLVNSAGTVTGPLVSSVSGASADGWNSADAMTYASADSPTFTMTCSGDQTSKYSAGMRIKLTQTTVKYFIITKVEYSSSTTITLYGGTDYTLANAAITSPYYSVSKAPAGFPLDPAKWTVEVADTASRSQASPTNGTWYNPGSLSITVPIGVWRVEYFVQCQIARSSTGNVGAMTTLSTANNSESSPIFSVYFYGYTNAEYDNLNFRAAPLTATTKTAYYLNIKAIIASMSSITFAGDLSTTEIRAICAYL